jgi:hypothetical protein
MTTNAASLAALYTNAGLPCEIEAGPFGVMVYAASAAIVRKVANEIAQTARTRLSAVTMTVPAFEKDEPAESCYWARVDFDWAKLTA